MRHLFPDVELTLLLGGKRPTIGKQYDGASGWMCEKSYFLKSDKQ